MIEWYSSPALRRRCQAGLNKGEAAHKLKRAVFSSKFIVIPQSPNLTIIQDDPRL
jgi:hypothetical protein